MTPMAHGQRAPQPNLLYTQASQPLSTQQQQAQSSGTAESTRDYSGSGLRLLDRDGELLQEGIQHQPIPSYSSVFSPALNLSVYTARFLTLGDANQMGKIKESTLGENNTVALTSALVLTVQFAFLVLHLDEDYAEITEIWGNTTSGRPLGEVFEDCSIPYQLVCVTLQCENLSLECLPIRQQPGVRRAAVCPKS